jgi:hypothetical protein
VLSDAAARTQVLRAPCLAALLLLALALAPRDAAAATVTGLSTSLGLAAALLALLSLQAGSSTPAVAGIGLLILAALAHAVWTRRVRAPLRRFLPVGPVVSTRVEAAADPRLLAMAREQFLRLQAAWDSAEVDVLRELTTPRMLDELLAQLPERGPGPNRTDVLSLDVHLLSHETLGALELASVEFSGVVCESTERGPMPFREVWMLARSPCGDGGRWRLARQQALL